MVTTTEMCRLAKCSYRQLDYWVRTGVVRPHHDARGSGSRRAFSPRQVPIVRMITDLAALGATCPVLSAAADRAELIPSTEWLGLAYVDEVGNLERVHPGGSCWVVDMTRCSEGDREVTRQLVLA